MKALAILLVITPFWATNAFAQNQDIAGLLDNPETRTEIFHSILSHHQLMMDFMDAMKGNNHAMMMIRGDSTIMGNSSMMGTSSMMGNSSMMGSQSMAGRHMNTENSMAMTENQTVMMHQMLTMMKENPELLDQMMGNMMDLCEKDSTQCGNLAEVMSEHPHLMMMGMQKVQDGKMENNSATRMNMMNPEGSGMMQEYPEHK